MPQRRLKLSGALVLFILCSVVPASAGVNYNSGACVEFAEELDPTVWMPVGCELFDCCVRCPGNVIDWRIVIGGAALESVLLQFDNLPPDERRALKIKGKARWEGNSLRVWKGETIVSGFIARGRSAPAVAAPKLFANKEALSRLQESAGSDAATRGRMEVVVEQLMGKYVVDEARLVYNVTKCFQPGNTDHFLLSNNIGNDSAAVILDARNGTGNCVNDQSNRGNVTVFVGDLRTNGSCRSEAVIFSDDNAMAFVSNVFWSDTIFDMTPVTLQPIRVAPVAVWLAIPGVDMNARFHMGSANVYYNFHNTGIAFDATYTDVSTNTAAIQAIGGDCPSISSIKASDFYAPNQLNIYYIQNSSATWRGRNCNGEPNITFINTTADQQTLTHEIGHAFSLNHPNDWNPPIMGLAKNNIMWSGETGRTDFTLGQAFRMNMNVTSKLNLNGVRTGPVRDPACGDEVDNDACPRLALDVYPK